MTTFILMLKPGASAPQVSRVVSELEERFPEHEFVVGEPSLAEYSGNILAAVEEGAPHPPDPEDVNLVVVCFRRLLREIDGWKPS